MKAAGNKTADLSDLENYPKKYVGFTFLLRGYQDRSVVVVRIIFGKTIVISGLLIIFVKGLSVFSKNAFFH